MSALAPVRHPVVFQARWNKENIHLKEDEMGLCGRILAAIKRVLSCLFCGCFKSITHRVILPAAYVKKTEKQELHNHWHKVWFSKSCAKELYRQVYQAIPLQITTPEGNRISGVFYKNLRTSQKDIPTILYCGGNGELFKRGSCDSLIGYGTCDEVPPFNIAMFDYPGCGESTGKISAKTLVLAGDSVLQCVRDRFKVSEQNIRLVGRSLGGGVVMQLAAHHPKIGRVLHSHSFKSLRAMIYDSKLADKMHVGMRSCLKSCTTPQGMRKISYGMIKRFFGEFDSEKALKKIKSPTMIVYHPEDTLMQDAHLAESSSIQKNRNVFTVRLQTKDPDHTGNHHNGPYEDYCDERGNCAQALKVQFLLGRAPG